MKEFEKLDADTAKKAEKAAEEITRRNKETYKKIKGYLDQAHERYAKKGTLTMDDMRKFNRLKNLENAIAEAMEENRILTDKEIEKLLSESAKNALYVCTKSGGGGRKEKSIRAIKKDIDVAKILDETVAGRNWKERTKHLSANAAYDIITEVRKGIDQGDSFHDMAKAIKKKMGEYNGRPITIAKTETHRVIETTKFKAMESVNKQVPQLKVWRTVSDERVRDSHKAMEGQTVKLDEEFTLPSGAKTMYPGQSGIAAEDINCRCFVEYIDAPKEIEYGDEEAQDDLNKIAENVENNSNKGYNVIRKNKRKDKKEEAKPEEIPPTLINFKNHTKKWEDDVVSNILNKKEIEKVDEYMKSLIDENEFAMRRKVGTLEKIVSDGRFKTQFETGTSGGTLDMSTRTRGANQLFGEGQDFVEDRFREKYGYLGESDFIKDNKRTKAKQYGDCVIHFKKEALEKRTTFTIDDSLGSAICNEIVAGDINNPRANGIDMESIDVIHSMIKNNLPKNLQTFLDETEARYFELQYHGELSVDDISEICFTNSLPSQNTIDKLKSKGIKLYKIVGGDECVGI